MWNGIDGRRFPRVDYKCIILIKGAFLWRHIKTHTENIGVGGICVMVRRELKKFGTVKLKVVLENGSAPIECGARVVWTVKRDLAPSRALYDTGIEFIDIGPADKERIERIVASRIKPDSA